MIIKLRILSLVLILLFIFSTTAFAADNLSTNDLMKEFTNDEPSANDSSVIKNDISLPADENETLDGVKGMIQSEPSNQSYYDTAAGLYDKNGNSSIQVFSDGSLIDFSKYNNVLPVLESGRTMVPARALAESMGAKVDWNPANSLITITFGDKTVLLTLNSSTAYVNGTKAVLDAPAKSIGGRTMIPLRFVSQNFGKTVGWHTSGNARVISISD